jgi:uncharacterized protein (TIGR02444 family)
VESFWDFSVRTYRTSGVSEACLSLQNDQGADVNMLLYCCWVGAAVGSFDDELFSRASKYSARWAANVVIPLREARSWMKHTGCTAEPTPTEDCMQLREQVKSVEFAAEKMQEEVLESMVSVDRTRDERPKQIVEDVAANLMLYLEGLDIQPAIEVRNKLSVIVCAAFPDFDKKTIAKAIETAS